MFLCLLMLKELNEQANNSNYNNVNNTALQPSPLQVAGRLQ